MLYPAAQLRASTRGVPLPAGPTANRWGMTAPAALSRSERVPRRAPGPVRGRLRADRTGASPGRPSCPSSVRWRSTVTASSSTGGSARGAPGSLGRRRPELSRPRLARWINRRRRSTTRSTGSVARALGPEQNGCAAVTDQVGCPPRCLAPQYRIDERCCGRPRTWPGPKCGTRTSRTARTVGTPHTAP